jgi:hypothetical protein
LHDCQIERGSQKAPRVARAVALEVRRSLRMVADAVRLVIHLVRKMLPTRRVIFFAVVRLTVGLATVRLSGLIDWEPARGWVEFAGRIYVVLAIMNLLAHSEAIFMDALARNVERATGFRIGG